MGNPKKETRTQLILIHASTHLGREYLSMSTCLKRVLVLLVFVQVFAEYSYDVSCLHNQIKFTYARSGVPQTVLVSAFVVEWAKNKYIGLFYMLQSILKK